MPKPMKYFDDLAGGRYLRAADFAPGERLTLTIASITPEEMSDGEQKWVISFREDPRKWILNGVNRDDLKARFGREVANAVGEKVTLLTRPCNGPNGPTQGIRLADLPVAAVIGDDLPDAMKAPAKKQKRAFR